MNLKICIVTFILLLSVNAFAVPLEISVYSQEAETFAWRTLNYTKPFKPKVQSGEGQIGVPLKRDLFRGQFVLTITVNNQEQTKYLRTDTMPESLSFFHPEIKNVVDDEKLELADAIAILKYISEGKDYTLFQAIAILMINAGL